jgi:hypothetical protein
MAFEEALQRDIEIARWRSLWPRELERTAASIYDAASAYLDCARYYR